MKAAIYIFFSLLPGVVLAKPSIDWLSVHWPPFRITEGPLKGQGHVEQLQQLLMAELPQYEHRQLYSNLARVEQTLAAPSAQTCIFSILFTKKRAETLRFSIPAVMSANMMLHLRADSPLVSQWQSASGVALADLTAEPAMKGVVEHNRGYPTVVAQYMDVAGSNLSSHSLYSVNPVELLTAQRIDYLIEYPDRVRYFQSIASQKGELVDLPLRGLDPLIYSYVACQAGAGGQSRLRDINSALRKVRSTKAYQQVMLQWLSPHRQLQLQQALPQFVSDETSPTP
ncbi:MAG: hypothetical protein KKF79_09515 [Gammaproteobacteria bacterium]|jgi:uncharacterized protein (TIGR02285 family)|nr:hypothetical protein [Gammaproteobacteria bacterium]